MITFIIVLVILCVVSAIFTRGSDARRTRESQERLERHAISQLPPPVGFEDMPAEAIFAVRDGSQIRAVHILHKQQGLDIDQAKERVQQLQAALRQGPELGRPPTGLFS